MPVHHSAVIDAVIEAFAGTDKPYLHTSGVWVEPGRAASFVWTFARTPNLEFACNIPGHYEDGMKGPIRFVKWRGP